MKSPMYLSDKGIWKVVQDETKTSRESIESCLSRIESILNDIRDGYVNVSQGHIEILKVISKIRQNI